MSFVRQATRAPVFARHIQTAATRKSRKFSSQAVSFAATCAVAGAAAAHFHLKNSVIHNDTTARDLPVSGEVNLETSRKDRGKGLLTSEGWGSNRSLKFHLRLCLTHSRDYRHAPYSYSSKLLVFDGSQESLKSPTLLPWLDGVALRDLVLHETHAACVDARGDVYQWGSVLTQGNISTKPVRTLRGKVRGLGCLPAIVTRVIHCDHPRTSNNWRSTEPRLWPCLGREASLCYLPRMSSRRPPQAVSNSGGLEIWVVQWN